MKRRMHKGFTLVELLIVVAILGILSAAMMVATQNATPKARANQIATDLKAIASAAALYCADNEAPTADDFNSKLGDYLFGTDITKYSVALGTGTAATHWIATYATALDTETEAQMDKIKAAAGITITAEKKATMRIR